MTHFINGNILFFTIRYEKNIVDYKNYILMYPKIEAP